MGVPTFMANRFAAGRAYQTAWKNWEQNKSGPEPRRDLELEALSEIIAGDRLIHCHSYRQDEIVAFLRTMESFGIRVATLQHVLEGYKVADEIAKHGAGASCFSDWWAYKFEVIDAIPYAGAIMHDRKVVVSFNSDSSDLSRRLYSEAAKAVKYGGVSEEEALKFITINPATQLRIDARVGSLEVGKDGDFALWSKSPLEAGTICEQTWIEGKKYFDRNFVSEKSQALQQEREQLLAKAKKAAGLSKPEEISTGSKAAQAAFFLLPWELQFENVDRHCDSH
jgi:imidazolonepropionase-like amidohydrolase